MIRLIMDFLNVIFEQIILLYHTFLWEASIYWLSINKIENISSFYPFYTPFYLENIWSFWVNDACFYYEQMRVVANIQRTSFKVLFMSLWHEYYLNTINWFIMEKNLFILWSNLLVIKQVEYTYIVSIIFPI